MRVLLFGKNGQVGWELNRSLQPLGEVIALGKEDADFSKPASLRDIVQSIKPDIIVNASAYTAVDKAEEDEGMALIVNAEAPVVLAEEALKIDALLVHYSTDYVFDGKKPTPYVETDTPSPINVYGRSKLKGEVGIQATGCRYLILRTSWVYASRGHNFLLTILKLATERESLSIICDQVGSPTSARFLAEVTLLCIEKTISGRGGKGSGSGVYHVTASGDTTWYEFALTAIDMASSRKNFFKVVSSIEKITTAEYPVKAARPLNSHMDSSKVMRDYGIELPGWKNGLALCIDELFPTK